MARVLARRRSTRAALHRGCSTPATIHRVGWVRGGRGAVLPFYIANVRSILMFFLWHIKGISKSTCKHFMQTFCDPSKQNDPMMMSMGAGDPRQSVAAFLITRPPIAFLGWGWESDDKKWDDIFLLQAGEPKGLCVETGSSSGIFEREWSNGKATLDCNTYTAELPFPSL